MMTDIIGFTGLVRKGIPRIREISRKYKSVLQARILEHGGTVMHIFGDSALVLFDNPSSAIQCSTAIHQDMARDPAVPLRIALHHGKTTLEGNELYGEAVNLASRVLKMARASTILLSDTMRERLGKAPGQDIQSIGMFELKYVDRPVELFAVCAEGLVIPEIPVKDREERVDSRSIAVLCLLNLGGDRENDYLGEVMSEAIIHSLARIPGIQVTARSSSFALKHKGKDIREIGKILGVAQVLEGSVLLQGNRLRVTAQLIDAATGFHLLSEMFDRELQDIFTIQEEVAWLIAKKLSEKIDQREKDKLIQSGTSNPRALNIYLQARQLLVYRKENNLREAIGLFKQSLEIDPGFVLACTGISMCYLALGALRISDDEESYQRAGEYALRAMQINPDLPEVMVVHALSSFWISNWNLKNFEQIIGRALNAAPGSAEIRLFLGMYRLMSGDPKSAVIEVRLANSLDPLNPQILSRLGYIHLCLKDFDEAHDCFRRAHNTAPFAMYFKYLLAWSYLLRNAYDLAERTLGEVDEEMDVYRAIPGTRGYLYAKQGKLEEAWEQIRLIGKMEDQVKFPHYNLTLVYAGMNRLDEMFHHLEKAFTEKPAHLMFIQSDPFWDDFRDDPRFMHLIKKVFRRSTDSTQVVLYSDTRDTLRVRLEQLLYIRAEDNYSRVVLTGESGKKEIVLRTTLQKLEQQLSGTDMARCHRSYLVNLLRYSLSGDSRGYRLSTSEDPCEIPVSRNRAREVQEHISRISS